MSNESQVTSLLPGDNVTFDDASATVKGVAKLSVPPVSMTNPIFLADLDPRLLVATDSQDGMMSSDDKTKLDGIETGAEIHETYGTGLTYNPFTNVLSVNSTDSWVSPEFENVTLQEIGSGGASGFDAGFDTSGFESYYSWSTDQFGQQEGAIYYRFYVPQNFGSWSNIEVYHKNSEGAVQTKLTVELYGTNGTLVSTSGGSDLVNTSWTKATVTVSGGTFSSNSVAFIKFRMFAGSGETQYLGRIRLNLVRS